LIAGGTSSSMSSGGMRQGKGVPVPRLSLSLSTATNWQLPEDGSPSGERWKCGEEYALTEAEKAEKWDDHERSGCDVEGWAWGVRPCKK